ncbi:MAG: hypothetical protein JSS89_01445 [Bacteroidetes bacterium]|nr:hypothetical protein [Bacteroidota bacterium]
MKTIHFDHSLFDTERSYLQDLIGKDLCHIGSNSIAIDPSHPELWSFHKWIEIANWSNTTTLRLEYSYGDTYNGNDFIELRIESIERERRALNADVSFGGASKFTIQKIETYGYEWDSTGRYGGPDILKENLLHDEQYNEIATIENSLLLYGANGRRIWIECECPTLDLIVSMDEEYIRTKLGLSLPEANGRVNRKRVFQ